MKHLILITAAVSAWAASPSRPDRPVIHVPFWIASGEPAEVKPEAKLNGSPAKVLRMQGPTDDMVLLLVMDLAGDLAQADPARTAVIEHVSKLPPNVWTSVLRAQDGLSVLTDPSGDREKAAGAIKGLTISGRAGLLDSVETVAQIADSMLAKSRARVAVVYVSDSNITNYREDYANPVINAGDSRDLSRRFPEGLVKEKISQLLGRLSVYETPLFIVHLDHRSDTLNEAYQTGLLELANASGGHAVFCRSNAEIPEAIAGTFRMVLTHQMLELQTAPGKAKQLDVELSSAGRELKYRTRVQIRR